MKKIILATILLCFVFAANAQKAPKPPMMALSTWNAFRANINDSIIRAQADALVSNGLMDVGYKYLNIDDGFFNGRDADGNIQVSSTKFPYGMKAVADYIHSKGLKAGMYGDAGPNTCASIWETPKEVGGIGAGFYNHEQQDMNLYFKTWGFNYLKVDYCGASQQSLKLDEETYYKKIKAAIDATGVTDYIYNVCRWEFPGTWVTSVADSWRISPDINATYGRMIEILDMNTFLAPFMSPGHYNDMDMLEIGNGTSLTYEENKAQMSLWCVLTSPLVLGTDLARVTAQTLGILKNTEAIAVNQDMTEQGHLISNFKDPLQVWSKKLNGKQSGERAVVLFNRTSAATQMTVNFADIDVAASATVRDLWAKKDLGTFNDSFTATVPSHGVVMVKISGTNVNPSVYEAEYAYMHNYHHLVNCNVIPNQARASQLTGASKSAIASYIGGNADNYIEFRDVFVDEDGKYPLTISYLCADDRTAKMTVNGVEVPTATFNSGGSSVVASQSVYVQLKAGANVIRFENTTKFAPDLDKITIGKKNASLPGLLTLEAEDASLTSDLQIVEDASASNAKIVKGLGTAVGSSITFPTFALLNSAGLYPITINYASSEKRSITLQVNGKNYPLTDLQSTTAMGNMVILVSLKQGDNSIVLKSSTPAPDIDNISLDLSRAYANIMTLEAESATLIKNTSDQPRVGDKAAASGGKVVGWLGNSATYRISFNNLIVKKTGNYKINVSYFCGENRNVTVKINGTEYTLSNLNSGSWDKQSSASIVDVPLFSTGNTIELYNATGWAPDIDKIDLDGTPLYDGHILSTTQATGMSKISADAFSVYPNPNNGRFIIKTEADQKLEIFGSLGAKVGAISIHKGNNDVSLANLPKGFYILKGENCCVRVMMK